MYINTLWSKLVYVCVGRCMCVGGGVHVCVCGEVTVWSCPAGSYPELCDVSW